MGARFISTLLRSHTPTIMTALGISGVFVSAYLAHRSTRQADRALGVDHTYKESWRYYILPLSVAAVSAGCIFGAHQVATRRIAAAGAVALAAEEGKKLLEQAVKEELGESGFERVRTKESEIQVQNTPVAREFINTVPDNEILVLESYSGRYFKTTAEKVRSAEKALAETIWAHDYVSLNAWYTLLGLDETSMGDDLGWNTKNEFELIEDSALTTGNTPVLVLRYANNPYDRYDRIY